VKLSKNKINIIPALFASSLDIFFTLFYQKASFWKGDHSTVNEANPIGNYLSTYSFLGLPLICLVWLIIIYFAGLNLPEKLREIFLLFCVIAHSWGAASWIDNRFGYWSVIVLFILNSSIYILIKNKVKGQIE